MKKKYIYCLIIVLILAFLDQLTKFIVIRSFRLGETRIIINNFLEFYYIKNTGASFGILSNQNISLILITIVLVLYILYENYKSNQSILRLFSTSLIIGGAIGNLIDRVFRKYVIDFISFTLFNHEMAIFNLADMFICFGVLIYFYIIIMEGKNERISNKE